MHTFGEAMLESSQDCGARGPLGSSEEADWPEARADALEKGGRDQHGAVRRPARAQWISEGGGAVGERGVRRLGGGPSLAKRAYAPGAPVAAVARRVEPR